MSPILLCVTVISVLAASIQGEESAQSHPCVCVESLGTEDVDFYGVTAIRSRGDGSGRLYIAELEGWIWIYQNGTRKFDPLLDLSLSPTVLDYLSLDLYSFAFHPNYTDNGRVYVLYSYVSESNNDTEVIRVSKFTRKEDVSEEEAEENMDEEELEEKTEMMDPESEMILLQIEGPDHALSRNGGEV